jgi:hypothetical protein
LWPVTPASHFPQPGSDSAQKTLATSGHTSPDQYELFDLDYASLKMSKDTSASASEKSLESWNQSVTQRRGEYSRRLKSALRTSASGSSSWPTISVNESKNSVGKSQLSRNSIPLGTMAAIDAANWPTATATNRVRNEETLAKCAAFRKRNANQNTVPLYLEEVVLREEQHGPAAPANPNLDGSRQGWSEERLWMTPRTNSDRQNSGTTGRSKEMATNLGTQVNWATPRSGKTTDENPETWAARQAKGDVATMPLTAQVKAWATPKASDPEHSGPNMRDSAGNYALPAQAVRENWLTPKVPSGGGQATRETQGGGLRKLEDQTEARQTGKLNPRWVETLMGLPVGWVMPSCASPQTIAPTNYDSSATESCQPQPRELFEF